MIRKIILSSMFIIAVFCGIGFGYGATVISKIVFTTIQPRISELSSLSFFNREEELVQQGGPAIIESDLNQKSMESVPMFVIKDTARKPNISGKSFLVADIKTGKVLSSKNISEQLPIASISKLMTALVADETLGLDISTSIQSFAVNTYGTQGELQKGEIYTIQELLYPLLLESSNDAAEAIASTKNREEFITDMNNKAYSIGLLNTYYEDPSGLSSQNISTVTDLFRLTQYIYTYRSYIFDITHEYKKELGKKIWVSNSRFKNDLAYVGGKNGYTDEAHKTQVALFRESFANEDRVLVYIVLKSNDVVKDIKILREYIKKNVSLEE